MTQLERTAGDGSRYLLCGRHVTERFAALYGDEWAVKLRFEDCEIAPCDVVSFRLEKFLIHAREDGSEPGNTSADEGTRSVENPIFKI
ncbi:hypothetical protein [Halorubrum sp. DTA98]|uniref:hypothetical protein n=1 Tax=Halorubrum sp. DTA98 TaxID=3402163 RepID=UPI003AAA9FEC